MNVVSMMNVVSGVRGQCGEFGECGECGERGERGKCDECGDSNAVSVSSVVSLGNVGSAVSVVKCESPPTPASLQIFPLALSNSCPPMPRFFARLTASLCDIPLRASELSLPPILSSFRPRDKRVFYLGKRL